MKTKLLSCLLLLTLLFTMVFTACDDSTTETGSTEGSAGLEYKASDDGKSCTITGIGTCTDEDVKIPEVIDGLNVVGIGAAAFAQNENLKSIEIPSGVKTIATNAFVECASLSYVVLPTSLEKVSPAAFRDCALLKTVYYMGGANHWTEVSIGNQNDELKDATVLYYSEFTPTSGNNYWHFNEENKPVKW